MILSSLWAFDLHLPVKNLCIYIYIYIYIWINFVLSNEISLKSLRVINIQFLQTVSLLNEAQTSWESRKWSQTSKARDFKQIFLINTTGYVRRTVRRMYILMLRFKDAFYQLVAEFTLVLVLHALAKRPLTFYLPCVNKTEFLLTIIYRFSQA